MDHFSTVLQRPPHFDEDGSNGAVGDDRGPRGGLRDILNPVSSTTQTPGTPGAPAPPRPHSSFSLRSPTQHADYHHHPSAYAASPSATGTQPSGSRSILNNPFGSASTPSLPPSLQPPAGISSSTTPSGLQHPPRSPLHAPPAYYPSEIRDRESIREKSGSSGFYDPTTDNNRDRQRRVSESGSWRSANSPPKVSKQPILAFGERSTPMRGTKPLPLPFVLSPSSLDPINLFRRSSVSSSSPPSLPRSNRRGANTFSFFFLYRAASPWLSPASRTRPAFSCRFN